MSSSRNVTISDFERIAEEQKAAVALAVRRGEEDCTDLLRRWQETLDAIRYMKEHGVPDSKD